MNPRLMNLFLFLVIFFGAGTLHAQSPSTGAGTCHTLAGRTLCIGQQAVTNSPGIWNHGNRIWGVISSIDPQNKIVRARFNGSDLNFNFDDYESARKLRTREETNQWNSFRVGMEVEACNFEYSENNTPSHGFTSVADCREQTRGMIRGVFRNKFQGREDLPLYAISNARSYRYTFYLMPFLHAVAGVSPLADLAYQLWESVHSASIWPLRNPSEIREMILPVNDLQACVRECQIDFQASGRCVAVAFQRNSVLSEARCKLLSNPNLSGQSFDFNQVAITKSGEDYYHHRGYPYDLTRSNGQAFESTPFLEIRSGSMPSQPSQSTITSVYLDGSTRPQFADGEILHPFIYLRVFPRPVLQTTRAWMNSHSPNYQIVQLGTLQIYAMTAAPFSTSSPQDCQNACERAGLDCLGFYFSLESFESMNSQQFSLNMPTHTCRLVQDGEISENGRTPLRNPLTSHPLSPALSSPRAFFAAKTCVALGNQHRPSLINNGQACNPIPTQTVSSASAPNQAPLRQAPRAAITSVHWRFTDSDVANYDLAHSSLSAAPPLAEEICKQSCTLHNRRYGADACNAFSLQRNENNEGYICWLKHLPSQAVILNQQNHIILNPSMASNPVGTVITVLPSLVRSNLLADVLGRCEFCTTGSSVSSAHPVSIFRNAVFDGYVLGTQQLSRRALSTSVLDQCISRCHARTADGCNTVRISQTDQIGSLWRCDLQALPQGGQPIPRALPNTNRRLVISVRKTRP